MAQQRRDVVILDLGRAWLEANGVRAERNAHRLMDQLFGATRDAPGMWTTSDFSNFLVSTARREMLQAYEAAREPLIQVARVRTRQYAMLGLPI